MSCSALGVFSGVSSITGSASVSGSAVRILAASGTLSAQASVTGSANLSFSSGQNKGVLWSDLKYAIRVQPIIKAIETKYSLTFSTDFFNTSNARFYNLYLWMQRKQGNLVEDVQEFTSQVSGFAVVSGGTYVVTSTSSLAVQRTISSITLTTVVATHQKYMMF